MSLTAYKEEDVSGEGQVKETLLSPVQGLTELSQ